MVATATNELRSSLLVMRIMGLKKDKRKVATLNCQRQGEQNGCNRQWSQSSNQNSLTRGKPGVLSR